MTLKILVGRTGLICSELARQEAKEKKLVLVSRTTFSVLHLSTEKYFSTLLNAIMYATDGIQEDIQIVFAFRSRSNLSLDKATEQVINTIKECSKMETSQKLSIAFLNSICSIENESSQNLFYHLEKSLMSRLFLWYRDDDIINSSVNIILHKPPREPKELINYIYELRDLLAISNRDSLNGASINFGVYPDCSL